MLIDDYTLLGEKNKLENKFCSYTKRGASLIRYDCLQKKHISFGATELTEAEDWILSIQQVLTRIHNVSERMVFGCSDSFLQNFQHAHLAILREE